MLPTFLKYNFVRSFYRWLIVINELGKLIQQKFTYLHWFCTTIFSRFPLWRICWFTFRVTSRIILMIFQEKELNQYFFLFMPSFALILNTEIPDWFSMEVISIFLLVLILLREIPSFQVSSVSVDLDQNRNVFSSISSESGRMEWVYFWNGRFIYNEICYKVLVTTRKIPGIVFSKNLWNWFEPGPPYEE